MQIKRFLALAVAATFAVGACSTAASPSPSAAPASEPAATAAPSASAAPSNPEAVIPDVEDGAEITFWTFYLSPTFDDYIKATIARFEETYPGVTVKWEDHQATFLDDYRNAFAAGNAPDVANLSNNEGWVREFAEKDLLLSMTDNLPADVIDDYFEGLFNDSVVDGKSYQVPWYQAVPVELVNTEKVVTNNVLSFTGSVTATPIEDLDPVLYAGENWDRIRKLDGAFIIAPTYRVAMWGSFGNVGGSVICAQFQMGGSAEGTIEGSIIQMRDDVNTSISGSADVVIASTGTTEYPPGVTFGHHYTPVYGSYKEVRVD